MKKLLITLPLILMASAAQANTIAVENCIFDSNHSYTVMNYKNGERLDTPEVTLKYQGKIIPPSEHANYKQGNVTAIHEGTVGKSRLSGNHFGSVGATYTICKVN